MQSGHKPRLKDLLTLDHLLVWDAGFGGSPSSLKKLPPRHTCVHTHAHSHAHVHSAIKTLLGNSSEMPTDVVPRRLSKSSSLSLLQSWLIGETAEGQGKFLSVISNLAVIV